VTFAWGLAAGLAAAVLFGVGAVAQAHAVRRQEHRTHGLVDFVRISVRDPWTLAVVVAYLLGFVLHVVAIWGLPLYLAQATIAMSLPVTAVTSLVLHERLQPVHWWAVLLVTAGLVLLSAGSGEPGAVFTSAWFAVALWMGVLVLLLAARVGVGWPGSVIATLAGLAYTGSAVAVRGTESATDVVGIAVGLSIGVYGLLGFWLYSVALDRAPVSSASAPLIVTQTFVPSLIGVAFLGDGVRPGWWPAIVAGLVLATAGAVVLSGDGIASPVNGRANGPVNGTVNGPVNEGPDVLRD
jgi:drug/metabolite transporter (DMT)-like permease